MFTHFVRCVSMILSPKESLRGEFLSKNDFRGPDLDTLALMLRFCILLFF